MDMEREHKIELIEIKDQSNPKTYLRGKRLMEQGYVYGIKSDVQGSLMKIRGEVEGSSGEDYHVCVDYDLEEDKIEDFECECAAFFSYAGMCKHCVALALSLAKEEKKLTLRDFQQFVQNKQGTVRKSVDTAPQLANLIHEYSIEKKAKYIQPELNGKIELEPTLIRNYHGWSVSFRVGAEFKYVIKDLHTFLDDIEGHRMHEYGKKLAFIHENSAFTEEAREILSFLQKEIGEFRYYRSGGNQYYHYFAAMRELALSNEARCEFLHLMSGKNFHLKDYLNDSGNMEVIRKDPSLAIKIEKLSEENGYSLILPKMEAVSGMQGLYVTIGGVTYECSGEYTRKMAGICELGNFIQEIPLNIKESDMSAFCSTILPSLQTFTKLSTEGDLNVYLPQEAVIKIYVDIQGHYITAKVEASYGDKIFSIIDSVQVPDAFRDLEKESYASRTVSAYFEGVRSDKCFWIDKDNDDKIYHLLTTGMDQINEVGEVYISETFKKLKVRHAPTVAIGVSVKSGMLDLVIESGRMTTEELEGYLQSYRQKRKFYRMKNGEFMELENSSFEVVSELVEGLRLKPGQIVDGQVELPRNRAFYLDQVLKSQGEGAKVHRDASFKAMIRDMRDVEDSDYEVPDSLKTIMRNYQMTGYRWLCTLHKMGFGGILADDMGLGKTLQVIAFLLNYKLNTQKRMPSLIVCPASLVYNWGSEIERFAPQLTTLLIAGGTAERKENLKEAKKYDVCITSYDLLKRDLDLYEGKQFYVQVIDEAQNIKNHNTLAAKAVKSIVADTKFALTGTPIENRLSELWSIFDYLMSQMLGSYQKFKSDYESPIVQSGDEQVVRRLQKMIKPFILRRVKADVLKDLPEKEENIIYSKLEGEQQKLYKANVQKMLDTLNKMSGDDLGNEKLQILAQLTKLRQICCAPSLAFENYQGESAKLNTCMELLKNAVEGGHKVLIFSQFTSLFSLLEIELKKENMEYFKLTGATSKVKRAEMVQEFNVNDVPVFMISLKAGGTGLNLTGASIVIHFDPWWNVAAQNQATDRAHRIGQKNAVSVYKLIAKNTIEEKILKLQEAKRDLSDQIISQEGVSAANLSKEDFIGILEM